MKTNSVQISPSHPSGLDKKDRTLLRLLAERADRSYAELAEKVHLSAPAVHERVKRMKRDGVILERSQSSTARRSVARCSPLFMC